MLHVMFELPFLLRLHKGLPSVSVRVLFEGELTINRKHNSYLLISIQVFLKRTSKRKIKLPFRFLDLLFVKEAFSWASNSVVQMH